MMENRLDVLITCFNHEKSIEKSINSVLNQKTSLPIKILCFDDFSSDRSLEIIKEIQNKHPDKIKIFSNKKNMGRGRYSILHNSNDINANSKYWCILDGDDFWINDTKVQSQIDMLEKNDNYIGCGGISKMVDKNNNLMELIDQDVLDYNLKSLILLTGKKKLYMHPSTIIWKNVYYNRENFYLPKKKFKSIYGDMSILYLMLNFNKTMKIACLKKIVSQYNFNEKGVWSSLSKKDRSKIEKYYFLNFIKMVSFKYKLLILMKKIKFLK